MGVVAGEKIEVDENLAGLGGDVAEGSEPALWPTS